MQKISKSQMLKQYLASTDNPDPKIIETFKKKPIRSLSGITPVTALTKPYPCPGQCIFCPQDIRMPKSYIATEPGAQRAGQNGFDPYLQVYNRLQAYTEIAHPVSKIELIVLGGTWSAYPETYQIWFIKRMFEALNDFGAKNDHRPIIKPIDLTPHISPQTSYNQFVSNFQTNDQSNQSSSWNELIETQHANESAACRCVGLVLETRPDCITPKEVIRLKRLGATKIQIGIQSLSDRVLALNQRGHTVSTTKAAINLLRQAGLKIHAHWMPNLYGSNPEQDMADFDQLFQDPDICPDELKVYPCSLIPDTKLVELYQNHQWQPYTREELNTVLTHVLTHTPEYCRLTRIIRDIPGQEILEGNKTTNLRQLIEAQLDKTMLHDIRAREIKNQSFTIEDLFLDDMVYQTTVSTEHFLQFITNDRHIAAFLRLSLPKVKNFIPELHQAAIIREIHVYGQSIDVGFKSNSKAQHQGLGKKLITQSIYLAKTANFPKISVISAIGTREYYKKLGFTQGELYQHLVF